MKIWIVGSPGAGTSYLGKKLSKHYGIKYYETDDIYWKKKYTVVNTDSVILKKIRNITKKKDWIVEGGHYKVWIKEEPKKADIIVYLKVNKFKRCFNVIKRDKKRLFRDGIIGVIKFLKYTYKHNKEYRLKHLKYETFDKADKAFEWIIAKYK